MSLLPEHQIAAVHRAAVTRSLSPASLHAGLDSAFRGSLPVQHNNSAQLLSDLHVLNQTESLADGSVPLASWLGNAISLTGPFRECSVFKGALEAIARPVRPSTPGPTGRSATRPSVRKLLGVMLRGNDFDAFCVDYFEKAYRRFQDGMDLTRKVNILFDHGAPDEIVAALRRQDAGRLAALEHLLEYEGGAESA